MPEPGHGRGAAHQTASPSHRAQVPDTPTAFLESRNDNGFFYFVKHSGTITMTETDQRSGPSAIPTNGKRLCLEVEIFEGSPSRVDETVNRQGLEVIGVLVRVGHHGRTRTVMLAYAFAGPRCEPLAVLSW